ARPELVGQRLGYRIDRSFGGVVNSSRRGRFGTRNGADVDDAAAITAEIFGRLLTPFFFISPRPDIDTIINIANYHSQMFSVHGHRPNPRFRSSRRSSTCSIPTDKRISPSSSPAFLRSSLGMEAWVMTAGNSTSDSTPPRLSAILNSRRCARTR